MSTAQRVRFTMKLFGVFFLIIIASSECSKILFMHPSFSKSHVMPLQVLAKELAKRGHEITFVGLYPLSKPMSNYKDIIVEISAEKQKYKDQIEKAMTGSASIFEMMPILKKLVYEGGNETLQSEPIKKLMRDGKFDLVITGYFVNEYLLGFADHFKCPSIVFCSGSHVAALHKMLGNPLAPEGTYSALSSSKDTNFVHRVKNFLIYGMELLITRFIFFYQSKSVYE